MYQIVYFEIAEKFIRKQEQKIQKKLKSKIELAATDPFTKYNNLDKLKNTPDGYQLRVGNIRVLYKIYPGESKLVIWDINYRSGVYTP